MVGEKTKRLQEMKNAGFNVPAFFTIESEQLIQDPHELAELVRTSFSANFFAVRSSALVEDAETSSMAGQFLTKLGVTRDDLASAIADVCADAKVKLGSLDQFSIIVQEFIEADISGVTFTRNPNGGREMVTEFSVGRGDQVVGGTVTPKREACYRTRKECTSELPDFIDQKEIFLNIELLFEFPQDIEWCIKDDTWHILQSRPITSLSREQNNALIKFESELPKTGRYFFAKTEVCDVAPYPSDETFSLLQKLYATNGPVQHTYKKFGITYTDTQFLKRILGNLYIDREKELQSLFPSHSYFFTNDYRPRPVRLHGFFASLKNSRRLASLRGSVEETYRGMKQRLARPLTDASYEICVEEFLDEYEFIFTTSLFTESALQDLAGSLPKKTSLVVALQHFPKDMREPLTPPTDIIGNTFEFADTAPFLASRQEGRGDLVLGGIPEEKLRIAQEFLRLREYGRWLALRHISRIRRQITRVLTQHASVDVLLPSVITDLPIPHITKPLGVSSGKGTGKLTRKPNEGGILVVSSLTPELGAYADRLQGVIADHGGLLSHFAIIAREKGLPVIVNYPTRDLCVGREVSMDGTTGEVIFL